MQDVLRAAVANWVRNHRLLHWRRPCTQFKCLMFYVWILFYRYCNNSWRVCVPTSPLRYVMGKSFLASCVSLISRTLRMSLSKSCELVSVESRVGDLKSGKCGPSHRRLVKWPKQCIYLRVQTIFCREAPIRLNVTKTLISRKRGKFAKL